LKAAGSSGEPAVLLNHDLKKSVYFYLFLSFPSYSNIALFRKCSHSVTAFPYSNSSQYVSVPPVSGSVTSTAASQQCAPPKAASFSFTQNITPSANSRKVFS